jgi:hypothetical protein
MGQKGGPVGRGGPLTFALKPSCQIMGQEIWTIDPRHIVVRSGWLVKLGCRLQSSNNDKGNDVKK